MFCTLAVKLRLCDCNIGGLQIRIGIASGFHPGCNLLSGAFCLLNALLGIGQSLLPSEHFNESSRGRAGQVDPRFGGLMLLFPQFGLP